MKQIPTKEGNKMQHFLYATLPGRIVLKGMTTPFVSKVGGAYCDSRLSHIHIKRFMKRYHIDPNDYVKCSFRSYNDFFTRQIKPERRPVDMSPDSLISPCDAKLSVYPISEDAVFHIKGSDYTVEDLLENKELAKRYVGGTCLVFRLSVDDYHRYCYIDNGVKTANVYIKGKLHTVCPLAQRKKPIFIKNCREYTVLQTQHFGLVTEVEVGAMLVGRIDNYQQAGNFSKGTEKGKFLYGGSTVVVLLEKNRVEFPPCLEEATRLGFETLVRYGEKIGTAIRVPAAKSTENIP